MTVVAGSQNARLLAALSDGAWHTSRELHERCGYMRTNSRIAELRSKHGHTILGESIPGKTGTDGYRYRLVLDASLSERGTVRPQGHPLGETEAAPRSESDDHKFGEGASPSGSRTAAVPEGQTASLSRHPSPRIPQAAPPPVDTQADGPARPYPSTRAGSQLSFEDMAA